MKYLFLVLMTTSCSFFREPDYSDNLMYPKHEPIGNGYTVLMHCENRYKEDCLPWGVILAHKVRQYDMVFYKVQYGVCFDKVQHIVWVEYWCVDVDGSVPRKKIKSHKKKK